RSFMKKDRMLQRQLLKSVGVFAAAAMIAILIQSDNLTQIYEYSPYSTRGGKSVVETKTNEPDKSASGSAYYDYHTLWSFSPQEVMTFMVPSFYGFGNSIYNEPNSGTSGIQVNTYFGQMESVDVAMYMGVLVFFFALFAIFTCWKDPFVQFLTILSGIALFISFGKTFSPVFNFMFYYFPYFDKFRVPAMILVLVQLSMPFLAGLGINKIISLRKERDQRAFNLVKYASMFFISLFVVSLVLSDPIKNWFTSRMLESKSAGLEPDKFKALSEYISGMFISDAMIALALCALSFSLAYAYVSGKIKGNVFLLAIIVFTVFDLWRIDNRGALYTEEQNADAVFNEPGYVRAIKAQKDSSPFRVIGLRQDGSHGNADYQNANFNAYFLLQDIYGYSGIKFRAYQDIVDVLGNVANPTLWRMLNVKYVVLSKPVSFPGFVEIDRSGEGVVYRNDGALPRAYFVNSVQTRPALEILNLIKNNAFDPKETAFLEEDNIRVDRPDTASASAVVTSYKDEHITIQAKATGNNFLFLGDAYYPNGWEAYIDGKETRIYRTNHAFRGIVVPEGTHKVEFIFAPVSFKVSQIISLSLSSLVILGIILGLILNKRRVKE
ncbi:MAG: YfhO family protein, partial [Acidobacteriota bacterium]